MSLVKCLLVLAVSGGAYSYYAGTHGLSESGQALSASEKQVFFRRDGMTPEGMARLNSVMAGTLPVVFVNGTGKANPSFEEVAGQFRRTCG